MKKYLFTVILLFSFFTVVSNAQIISIADGNWSSIDTWGGGVVPAASDNVVIASGTTVTLDAATAEMNNLTIQGNLLFGKDLIVAMVIHGNLLVDNGGSFKVQTRSTTASLLHTITLYGDLTDNGTLDFRTGSSGSNLGVCNLILTGDKNTTLTVSTPYSSSNGNFNAITIDKQGDAKVLLGSDIQIDGGSSSEPPAQSYLTFIHGIIVTGDYTLIHRTGTSALIVGASDASYVYGNLGRGMANSGGSSKTFDVGDATGYRPFTLRSTTAGGSTGHYAKVGIISGNANTGSSVFTGEIDKVSETRYYKVTYNNGGSGATSMSFDKFIPSYRNDDGVAAGNMNLRVAYSTDDRATWNGLNQTVTHLTDLSVIPMSITPDSVATALQMASGSSFFVSLSRVSGTTENSLKGTSTDVVKEEGVPTAYTLSQNYPNPFNPSTNISFAVPNSGNVKLVVYNALGQTVETLVNKFLGAGSYSVNFDASNLTSGIYFYQIQADGFTMTRKMMLVK